MFALSTPIKPQDKGFTLLELLIAIAVFSIIALIAYQALATVSNQRDIISRQTDDLSKLQRLVTYLSEDLAQVINRPIRDQLGGNRPALEIQANNGSFLSLTRSGVNLPPSLHRSSLQRISYNFIDNTITRHRWQHLDRTQTSQETKQVLLDKVSSITVSSITPDGEAKNHWPTESTSPSQASVFPRAVIVHIKHQRWGAMQWAFPLIN